MGKKRKASGRNAEPSTQVDRSVSDPRVKLNVQSYEDVADSEDEFHLQQDRILLDEGPDRKRQRKLADEEAFFEASDEEVLGVPSSESEEELSEEDGEDATKQTTAQDDDDDSLGGDEPEPDPEEQLDREGWGDSKRDYYNADAIETEADALAEEEEALRLQKKQLQGMAESDYGLEDFAWTDTGGGVQGSVAVQEILPPVEIKESMTEDERRQILVTRYPEFEPLAREMLALQHVHKELSVAAQDALGSRTRRKGAETLDLPMPVLKRNACSAYMGALAMYFALLSGSADDGKRLAKPPSELREHTVMGTLVYTRDLWERMQDISIPDVEDEIVDNVETAPTNGDTLLADISIPHETSNGTNTKNKKKHRKTKAQKVAEKALAEVQAKRAARLARTEADLAKLSLPLPSKEHPTIEEPITNGAEEDDSDFGDADALTAEQAEAKAKRKRGLRFYTSQITQKSLKRDRMAREAGGDTDIPYRERLKDRQERLNAAAEARGKKQQNAGVQLGEGAEGHGEVNNPKANKDRDEDNEEDYYDLVSARTKRRKAANEAFAATQREAKAMGAVARPVEVVGEDGKRRISYNIEKNKGLTPHRKKDVRNPRVKKRKMYEDKKKKLSSIRAVYKGGQGAGAYGGELTGIKTNIVKSRKL